MGEIQERENKLFECWEKEFEKNGDTGFCYDGLIFNGELYNELYNRKSGNQEELWNNAKRKVLFFMKDSNNNEGEDYRNWGLYQKTSSTFFRFIYSWLNGLSTISAESLIPPMVNELNTGLPLCIVNAKKKSGGSSVSYKDVYAHVEKYTCFLWQQFEIYSPNIIVCGGSWKMVDIVKELFKKHGDIRFVKMDNSNWIWYSVENRILLIDSYHPGAFVTNVEKYDTLLEHFQEFLKINTFDL